MGNDGLEIDWVGFDEAALIVYDDEPGIKSVGPIIAEHYPLDDYVIIDSKHVKVLAT